MDTSLSIGPLLDSIQVHLLLFLNSRSASQWGSTEAGPGRDCTGHSFNLKDWIDVLSPGRLQCISHIP